MTMGVNLPQVEDIMFGLTRICVTRSDLNAMCSISEIASSSTNMRQQVE